MTKQLENRKTEINGIDGTKMSYANLIKMCADVVDPRAGVTVSEMRVRSKIIDACESANGNIVMELADFTEMKRIVNDFKWAAVHKNIIEMVDLINSL